MDEVNRLELLREQIHTACRALQHFGRFNKAFQSSVNAFDKYKKGDYLHTIQHSAQAFDRLITALEHATKNSWSNR